MKTIKFYTVGCKVNQYETQSIREKFIHAGFNELEDSQPADIYLINTCTVTHKADRDSFNLIHRAKRENPQAKIIVTGCLTELDAEKIKSIDGISLMVKNKDKEKILNYHKGISYFKGHTRAFLKIQDGCNNSCAYCKVPLVRGRSRSRDLSEIITEAKALVKNGFKEIVLCGICLGAYGRDFGNNTTLVNVIEELEKIQGLLRIRLSSLEVADVTEELIQKIAQSRSFRTHTAKLCPHLHLPLQSGDDEILKKMHRNYQRQDYLNLIKKIKEYIPDIAITTDVLVGFPGESEDNFYHTASLIKEIIPLRVHIFPYSPRAGTPAARDFPQRLNDKIIKKRINYLKKIAQDCSFNYKKRFLNKDLDVLIETHPKENKGCWQGYTDNYIKVQIESDRDLKNQLIPVKLKEIVQDAMLADFI